MLAGEVDGTRQLTLMQVAAKIGNFAREAQAPVAICRAERDGPSGANNAQTGGKIHQTPQQGSSYVHPLDELRRVPGVEQLSSCPGSAKSRIQGDFFFQLAADRKVR